MTNIEMIEKLSEKACVTRELAQEALIKSDWDILDAMLYLERLNGDNISSVSSSYSTYEKIAAGAKSTQYFQSSGDVGFGWYADRFLKVMKKLFKMSLDNSFVISKNGKKVISFPVLLFGLLTFVSISGFLILLLIGMFFDFKYSFESMCPNSSKADAVLNISKVNSVLKGMFVIIQKIKK